MKGHVHRRGDTFRYLFDIEPDPLSGRRRQATKGGFGTEAEAWSALRVALAEHEQGRRVAPSRRTVGQFLLEDWLPAARLGLKPSVAAQHEDYIRAYVVPTIGGTRLQDLTVRRLAALYTHLLENGRVRRRPGQPAGLAPKTIRNVHALLHKALSDAVAWQLLARNVAGDVKPPRVRQPRREVWSPEQMRGFLAAATDDRFYALYLLAMTTGMRRAELCGLRWADLDLTRGRLRVVDTRVVVRGHAVDSDTKTPDSNRPLALDPATVAALGAHRARQDVERAAFGSGWRNAGGRVFVWEDGRPVHPDVIRQRFRRAVERLGLPLIGVHGLRHSYATAALDAGVNPKIVSERLGHSSVAFTLQVYSHVRPRHDQDAANAIANIVLGPLPLPAPLPAADDQNDGAAEAAVTESVATDPEDHQDAEGRDG